MTADLTALLLGAGVQSTTLALLACEGELPKPDVAIFADTQREPAEVYAHLARLRGPLEAAGIDLVVVSKGDLGVDVLEGRARVPAFVATTDGDAMPSTRGCTRDYKLRPIQTEVRRRLGLTGKRVPEGVTAEKWLGFSTDEVHRVSTRTEEPWVHLRYPLLELGMSRRDCERWLGVRGWTVAKSACVFCPYHGNRAWRELRDGHPEEWAQAVAFDTAMREEGVRFGLRSDPFLHRSLLPLAQAPIDRVTSTEWRSRQTNLLDAVADAEAGYDPAEDGDPDGCGPYACRSGEPVAP